jgi:TetR/AcrR family transcriptional regulator, mexJK operon transcriptional repressor
VSDRPTSKSSGRTGRPKDQAKRAAILAAARRLIFAHGVEAVSMEEIAVAAGVSKMTVYGHFGDKATIFEAMARAESARIEEHLIRPAAKGTIAETLQSFGMTLMLFLSSEEIRAFDRVLALEASRHPDLARRFFDAGPGYLRMQLAKTIEAAMERGELRRSDPIRAAEDVAALWQGFLPLETRFGIVGALDRAEVELRVTRGVELFLRAHAPP